MPYQLFLQTLLQLSSKGKAAIALENGTIHIQPMTEKTTWRISMSLYEGQGRIPSSVRGCLPSTGILRWQNTGPHLQLDSTAQTLLLVDEIEIQKDKYISFKQKMNDFIAVSQEWQEIIWSLAVVQ
jgi:hypothetical protein